jgi:hypothetical protein
MVSTQFNDRAISNMHSVVNRAHELLVQLLVVHRGESSRAFDHRNVEFLNQQKGQQWRIDENT